MDVEAAIMDYYNLKNNSIEPGFLKRNLKTIVITTSILCIVLLGWYMTSINWNAISSLKTASKDIQIQLLDTIPEIQNTVNITKKLHTDFYSFKGLVHSFLTNVVNNLNHLVLKLNQSNTKIYLLENNQKVEHDNIVVLLGTIRSTCEFLSQVFIPAIIDASLDDKASVIKLLKTLAKPYPMVADFLNLNISIPFPTKK